MAYSKGMSARCGLVFFRDFETVQDEGEPLRLSCIAALLFYFDYTVTVLRRCPEATRFAAAKYGDEFEREYQKISKAKEQECRYG